MYLLLQWLRMSFDQITWTDLVTKVYKVQCLVLVLLWSHRIRKLLLLPQTRKLPTVVTVYYCTEVGNSQRNSQISDQNAMHLPAAARKAFLQHWKSYMSSFHWWHLIRILWQDILGNEVSYFARTKIAPSKKGFIQSNFKRGKRLELSLNSAPLKPGAGELLYREVRRTQAMCVS